MAERVSWSDLPPELLELIFNCRKNPIDILRCGAVCRSWKPVALKLFRNFFPLCLMQNQNHHFNTAIVFSLSSQELRMINLPHPERRRRICCCSDNGWLLTMEKEHIGFKYRYYLVNIFSRKEILLPPIQDRRGNLGFFNPSSRDDFTLRLFLSKCPTNSDCIIMVLITYSAVEGYTDIFCCHAGDKSWVYNWNSKGEKVGFPIMHKGKVYAQISGGLFDSRRVRVLNFHSPGYTYSLNAVCINIPFSFTEAFLVKPLDDNVVWLVVYKANDTDGKFFDIFSIDLSTRRGREIREINGLALFLNPDQEHPMLLPAKATTWFKADCIYFYRFPCDYLVYDIKTRHSEIVSFECLFLDCWRNFWIYPDE